MAITKTLINPVQQGETVSPTNTNRPILELEQNIDSILNYLNGGVFDGSLSIDHTSVSEQTIISRRVTANPSDTSGRNLILAEWAVGNGAMNLTLSGYDAGTNSANGIYEVMVTGRSTISTHVSLRSNLSSYGVTPPRPTIVKADYNGKSYVMIRFGSGDVASSRFDVSGYGTDLFLDHVDFLREVTDTEITNIVEIHNGYHFTDGEMRHNGELFTTAGDGSPRLTVTGTEFTYQGNTIWHSGNMGPASGLNADTLDGYHHDSFLKRAGGNVISGTQVISNKIQIDFYSGGLQFTAFSDDVNDLGSHFIHGPAGGGDDILNIFRNGASDYELRVNGTHKIWHSGNDGPSSGLNADLLDGIEGSQYLRSDVADTMAGILTLNNDLRIESSTPFFILKNTSAGGEHFRFSTGTAGGAMKFSNTGEFGIEPVADVETDTSITTAFRMLGTGDISMANNVSIGGVLSGNGSGLSNVDALTLGGQAPAYYLDWVNVTNKPDPTITLGGDLQGSVTLTDLGDATLTAQVNSDSHNHTTLANVTDIGFTNGVSMVTDSISTSATTAQTLTDFDMATYTSAEVVVQANDGTNRQITKLIITHDGTNAYATEYGTVLTGPDVFTTDVDISGGTVRVNVKLNAAVATVFRSSMVRYQA